VKLLHNSVLLSLYPHPHPLLRERERFWKRDSSLHSIKTVPSPAYLIFLFPYIPSPAKRGRAKERDKRRVKVGVGSGVFALY